MADLFRVLMADNRTLAPSGQEVELTKQYLAIEAIPSAIACAFLADRAMPADALVPPLMLQPLVENAVYHGIEPSDAGGEIEIEIARVGDRLRSRSPIRCPTRAGIRRQPDGDREHRERLQLHSTPKPT
jgi:two-component system sensor histidine kinase AlgZ